MMGAEAGRKPVAVETMDYRARWMAYRQNSGVANVLREPDHGK